MMTNFNTYFCWCVFFCFTHTLKQYNVCNKFLEAAAYKLLPQMIISIATVDYFSILNYLLAADQ